MKNRWRFREHWSGCVGTYVRHAKDGTRFFARLKDMDGEGAFGYVEKNRVRITEFSKMSDVEIDAYDYIKAEIEKFIAEQIKLHNATLKESV